MQEEDPEGVDKSVTSASFAEKGCPDSKSQARAWTSSDG
jgi:hypothetical protein